MWAKMSKQRKCVTHFAGCDCRERKFAEMESALKIIGVWARSAVGKSSHAMHNELRQIAIKCEEALGLRGEK